MKGKQILFQILYLAACVGVLLLCSYFLLPLFSEGNYAGTLIVAVLAFFWYYGNKIIVRGFQEKRGKMPHNPLK